MKIHNCEQNTLDWLKLHIGLPTASGLSELVDSNFDVRKGEMPKTYVYAKVTEAYRGKPLISLGDDGGFGSYSTEQGQIVEDHARPFYTLITNRQVAKVGFITTDDGRFGCSPDGLIPSKTPSKDMASFFPWEYGIEIKCPAAHTHVKWLIEGKVPKDYAAQVHASMYVTGLTKWVFMSYRRGFPPLIIEVLRDEEIMAKIKTAEAHFYKLFEEGKARLDQYEIGAK